MRYEMFNQKVWNRSGRLRHSGHRLVLETLENRELLASNLNFVLDSTGKPVTVDFSLNNRFGSEIAFIDSNYLNWRKTKPVEALNYTIPATTPNYKLLNIQNGGFVVDFVALSGQTQNLVNGLTQIGAAVTGSYGTVVSAIVQASQIDAIAGLKSLDYGRVSYKPETSVGLVDDQAVVALRSDVGSARFGVNGSGVTVGVLSDSFNNLGGYATDVASGDLPSGVQVLDDMTSGGTDEGRAMAQLIYDVAPGSSLAYNSAFKGQAAFAQGILNLAKPVAQGGAAAHVVVDDVGYFAEPFFLDGIVAKAVDQAVSQYGISYFSAAGNSARDSYESTFRSTTIASPAFAPSYLGTTSRWHDFDTSAGVDIYQPIQLQPGEQLLLSYQWDQTFKSVAGPGSQNDVDLFLVNASKTSVLASSASNNLNGDPVEILSYQNTSASATVVYLAVNLYSGTAPSVGKYVNFGSGTVLSYATNSATSIGHPVATNAAGVGAASYYETPAYNVSPAVKEYFTSAGGTPILFDANGVRLLSPEYRNQPRFVSIDGTDTTFFGSDSDGNGLPNFYGTSAAAPHAAAVAALMKQLKPSLTASEIYTTLQATSLDMGVSGYDYDTGWGLIQADRALASIAGISIGGKVFNDTNMNGVQDSGESSIPGATVFMDSNSNGILDSGTVTKTSTDVPKAIPDAIAWGKPSRVSSNLSVSGVTGRITNVTVKLSITHTYDSDLTISLISPSGIRVQLISANGGSGDNFTNTVLDDAAASSIASSAAPFTGTYRPVSQLAALIGENPNGLWQLECRDAYPADTGTLQSWSMNISSAESSNTTNSTGDYQFSNLPLSNYYGNFKPTAVFQPGYIVTAPASPYNYALGSGQTVTGANIGLATLSTTKVTNVTSSVPDYIYGIGTLIPVQMAFSDVVTVTGVPVLTLNSGATASYVSGAGTNTLVFNYTVSAGESSPDLDYSTAFALSGLIKDSANNPINYLLPTPGATGSLGFNKNIAIDSSLPANSISGRVYDVDTIAGIGHVRVYNDVNFNGKFDGTLISKKSATNGVRVLDLKTVTKTLVVSGAALPIYGMTISVNLAHSHVGDLIVTLISPAGTRVRLINRQGADGQNLKNATFDDSGGAQLPDSQLSYTGSYLPYEALSALNGQSANGTWTLEVSDNALGDVGLLSSFSVNVTSTAEPNVFTKPNGNYTFSNAAAGDWKLRVDLSNNPTWTVNNPVTGQINYTQPANTSIGGLNFGIKRPALIGAARMGVKLGSGSTSFYAVPLDLKPSITVAKPRARKLT